jgi:hypothetical protein
MNAWLEELRPFEGEARSSSGWRLAKAGWRLVQTDRAALQLTLLLAALWTALVAVVGFADLGYGQNDDLPLRIALDFGAVMVSTLLLGAIAAAAEGALDGMPLDLRDALAEARDRLRPLVWWTLASFAFWLGAFLVLREFEALGWLILTNLVWYVIGLFVIPIVMLAGCGPLTAVRESLGLLRRRKREVAAAFVGIAAFTAIALFPGGAVINHAAALNREGAGEQHLLVLAGFGLMMLVTAMTFATREAFAVILMREALDQLPGQPHSRRRRTGTKVLRLVLGVVAALAVLGAVSAATEHDREVLSASRAPGTDFTTLVSDAGSYDLPTGTPVLYENDRIGTVLGSRPDGFHLSVTFHVEPGFGPFTFPGTFHVEESGGHLSLVLKPANEDLPPDSQGYY